MKYLLKIKSEITDDIINTVFYKVFRTNYSESGFVVISFDELITSEYLRASMVALKKGLSKKCNEVFNETLDYYWLGRFNQQNTTKFHRDNATENSFLMLGYEPTEIDSKLYFADYHQLIADKKIPVDQYYELYNPIFKEGEELLIPYITSIKGFNKNSYNIILINNSDITSKKTLGVLHKAEIIKKDTNKNRIINSMMLYLRLAEQTKIDLKMNEEDFLFTKNISE